MRQQRLSAGGPEAGGGGAEGGVGGAVDCAASVASCSSSDDDYTLNSVHVGRLNEVVLELKGLLHGMLRRGMQVNSAAANGSLGSGSSR